MARRRTGEIDLATTLEGTPQLVDPIPELGLDERRYRVSAVLGEGGMGEVLLCHDVRLGRDVAMKRIAGEPELRDAGVDARFLREARVQGQLEHPSIVPVHDLDVDERGVPYFTMRRVRGKTMAAALEERGAAAGGRELHQLLGAFVRVCLTVHYAHTRGVVHRDLKPENVMLGDFGEVYVLDWGVAKALAPDAPRPGEPGFDESGERPTLAALAANAAYGADTEERGLVGTPAYMAPEQIRGGPIDARADVYALGAILFEILCGRALHDDCSPRGLRDRALHGVDARARVRAPDRDVPPELDAACVRATAHDPDARFATARDLGDAVEHFLAGHRDLATRRELAARHVAEATELARRALEGGEDDARGRAVERIGRAIALDPQDRDALELLARLLREPPRSRPAEVERQLEDAFLDSRRIALRRAVLHYGVFAPILFGGAWWAMGLRDVAFAAICIAAFALTGVVSLLTYRDRVGRFPWMTLAASGAIMLIGIAFGPFLLTPTLAIVNTMCHVIVGRKENRPTMVLLGVATILVPLGLELGGITPSTFEFRDGALILTSPLVRFREGYTTPFFVTVGLGLAAFASLGLRRYRDALEREEERTIAHAWLLRHLVPEAARAASEPPRARQPAGSRPSITTSGAETTTDRASTRHGT